MTELDRRTWRVLTLLTLTALLILALPSCVDITYRLVVPCTSDSAKAPADTIIRCSTLDSLARR